MSKIVEYIKTKRPYLNVIIWDDMIRRSLISDPRVNINNIIQFKVLIDYKCKFYLFLKPSKKLTKFAKSVVPMVWDYKSDITIDANVWKTYANIHFKLII